ncbi:MAG TPA: SprT-like domain-containing protein [Solirubrobacterales bacterium]|nr:SprT-like domain-containing protein [Solirubrobacterales bacterium]
MPVRDQLETPPSMLTKLLPRATKSRQRAPAGPRRKSATPRHARSYYLVAGVALDQELERLRALPVFADGPLATRRPELKVRRAGKRPNRLGFAVPTEFRLSVTAHRGIRRGDIQETLLHELVHLHVGRAAESHAWHGRTFKRALATAMKQAYGIAIRPPSSTRHGTYAEAIERARSQRHGTGNKDGGVVPGTDDGSRIAERS